MTTLPPFGYEFAALLIGAVVALVALRRPASVLDRIGAVDDTDARIAAFTKSVRLRARVASWLR